MLTATKIQKSTQIKLTKKDLEESVKSYKRLQIEVAVKEIRKGVYNF